MTTSGSRLGKAGGARYPEQAAAPRPLVICSHLPPDYGGAAIAGFRYVRRLRRSGGRPLLVGPIENGRRVPSGLPAWVYAAHVEAEGEGARYPRLIPTAIRELLRRGRPLWRQMWSLRREYEVVHIFSGASLFNLSGVIAGRLLGKKTVIEMSLVGCDDPVTLRTRSREKKGILEQLPPLRYLLFRLAHAHVSKSPALTGAYLESGMGAERLIEIPYGVDTREYRRLEQEQQRRSLRRQLGLPPGGVIALFVGGINPRKGVQRLLEAFDSVGDSYPELHLALVGPTSKYDQGYVREVRETAAALSERVTLVEGVAENVHEYMSVSDIYVLPSSREGLPISVLEAMASGLAVIASDIPEIADTQITSGENGVLVEVGDVAGLASALASVVRDDAYRRKLGQAARERAEARFSTDVVDREYKQLYRDLCSHEVQGAPSRLETSFVADEVVGHRQ